jgi:hypothetical protein
MASRAPGLRGRVSSRYRQLSCTTEHKNRQLCTKRRKTSLFRFGGELLVHASLYVMNSVAPGYMIAQIVLMMAFIAPLISLDLALDSDCDQIAMRFGGAFVTSRSRAQQLSSREGGGNRARRSLLSVLADQPRSIRSPKHAWSYNRINTFFLIEMHGTRRTAAAKPGRCVALFNGQR